MKRNLSDTVRKLGLPNSNGGKKKSLVAEKSDSIVVKKVLGASQSLIDIKRVRYTSIEEFQTMT